MSQTHRIEVFRPELTDEVIALIVGIQHDEFGVNITAADQPDLKTIPTFYQAGSGSFWVATLEGRVVGTIALKDIGNQQAALRKMFVAPEVRGKEFGVAGALLDTLLSWATQQGALLDTLLSWATQQGVQEIFLGTTEAFKAAHRFYEKNGFEQIPSESLPPAFPRMAQDTRFYRRSL